MLSMKYLYINTILLQINRTNDDDTDDPSSRHNLIVIGNVY